MNLLVEQIQRQHIKETGNAELCEIEIEASPETAYSLLKMGCNHKIKLSPEGEHRWDFVNGDWYKGDNLAASFEDVFFRSVSAQPIRAALRFKRCVPYQDLTS